MSPQILYILILCPCGMSVQVPYPGSRASCQRCQKLWTMSANISIREGDPYR